MFLKTIWIYLVTLGGRRRLPHTNTALQFTSSSANYITGGVPGECHESSGWTVKSNLWGNCIELEFRNAQGSDYWTIEFAAPNNGKIVIGEYHGATRFPFQKHNDPGMDFSGCHRGNNRLAGSFTVKEVLIFNGRLLTFAADFIQYNECREESWIRGSVRYNAKAGIDVRFLAQPPVSSVVVG